MKPISINEKIVKVVTESYPTLKLLKDDFFVIGSSALILTGIEAGNTSDIDILTSNRDADFLREIWKDKQIKAHTPKRSDLFRSNFSRYKFDILDIEILGELEVNKNNRWEKLIIQEFTTITNKEIQIKIPTLKEQERIFKWFGREKDIIKAELIQQYRAIKKDV